MPSSSSSTNQPILFLIGFPRSGTTWIANILAAHPETLYRHEIIGRDYQVFGETLFKALKFNHGLSDSEFEQLYTQLRQARIATDKPPFFPKHFRKINNIKIQKILWLAAKAVPFAESVWSAIYTPSRRAKATIVIKETRSSADLDSILKGLRATKMLQIIRHPYAVVASHVDGQKSGAMAPDEPKSRKIWFEINQNLDYLQQQSDLTEEKILNMPYTEYIALKWRAENEAYQQLCEQQGDGHMVLYESFLEHPEPSSRAMLTKLGLDYDEQVHDFVAASASKNQPGNILQKDSLNEYYSVFRSNEFNPEKWRRTLSENDIAAIDYHTKDYLEKLAKHPLLVKPIKI